MKVCCFVICYFGKLPNYIKYVLKTCAANAEYNWLLFTNDDTKYDYPENFQVELIGFEDFIDKIQKKFDFKLCISYPYKLCDLKPAYGYLFKEYLEEYPFWGHCDLDQFFGNLKEFIPIGKLEKYDKIFTLGHMTIYKNCKQMNELFKVTYCGNVKYNSYIEIFQNPNVMYFDEWPHDSVSINVLAEQEGIRVCKDTPMIDILPNRSCFFNAVYNYDKNEWETQFDKHFIILFDGKELYFVEQTGKDLYKQKVMYAHLQKRYLGVKKSEFDSFIIMPNRIISGEKAKITNSKWLFLVIIITKIRAIFKIDESKEIQECIFFVRYQLKKLAEDGVLKRLIALFVLIIKKFMQNAKQKG